MNIPGHIAIALTQHQLLSPAYQPEEQGQVVKALLAASLFPDVVDKTVGYVFHVMPNGRHYAHNIFSLVGFSAAATLLWGKSIGSAWFMGYLGHLAADSRRPVPWLFPVVKYHFEPGQLCFDPVELLKESVLLGLVLAMRRLGRS